MWLGLLEVLDRAPVAEADLLPWGAIVAVAHGSVLMPRLPQFQDRMVDVTVALADVAFQLQ